MAGDAAVLVDPTQTAALRDGLEQLLSDAGLRAELVTRGKRRLEAFTWERCTARLADLLEDVAQAA